MGGTWCVYKHTFPNGKVYIGITGGEPEERWDNGMGYKSNGKMFFDIVQFGWRNIAHEIVYDGLTEAEARKQEQALISSFGKDGRTKTYNRVHADYVREEQKDWIDSLVTEQSAIEHRFDFALLDDYWMEGYKEKFGTYPMNTFVREDGVTMNFISVKDGIAEQLTVVTERPCVKMTFREVWEWLNTTPEVRMEKATKFPVPEEFVQGLTRPKLV